MRSWTQLAEDDSSALTHKKLHSPDAGTRQCFRYLCCHPLSFGQMFWLHASWLEALPIVATLLHMTDGCAEESRSMLLCDGEQSNLVIEGNKLLHDDLHDVTTATFTSAVPSLLQFASIIHLALSVSTAAHERFDDAGEAYLLSRLLQFLIGTCISVIGCSKTQLGMCQLAYRLAVHGEVDSPCTGYHLYTLLFALVKLLCPDGFYLRHDDIRLNLIHHTHQFITVQHVEHSMLVGHLHGGCILILVASHHILAKPLACDDKLLA